MTPYCIHLVDMLNMKKVFSDNDLVVMRVSITSDACKLTKRLPHLF
jgi:hypothetical protein